ncbi:MAG TPA: bifunctional UDP-N-acetylglucosamine diphosphorylase/glucosamine-1-phosphate N-acetyltransferase GlmU [Methylophilaceae bacterium]|nr:bifunctional UDP-N-acetylglucosamine diphosphorylase/glucosamine-1-phosphate N-acetyltransferase GlmU [Methylophilaceae bacterium]
MSNSRQKLNIVILAAGKGTRMHSQKPKVLHKLAGSPLLSHVIRCAEQLAPQKIIVVYGFGGETVPQAFTNKEITWVQQADQLGTGHAMQQTIPHLDVDAVTLILLGDVPLVNPEACEKLLEQAQGALHLMSVKKSDPSGYGRIVRDENGGVLAIVEHKDATKVQRTIDEVNTGIMAVPNALLISWLQQLSNDNAQREYYLTDIVSMAVRDGVPVCAEVTDDEWDVTGVNSKQDLATLERIYQRRQAERLLAQGVSLADPARIDVRGELMAGRDVEIDVGCIFEGKVTLADTVKVGAYCVLKDVSVGSGTVIAPFSHLEQAEVAADCRIGPYARLRPGTTLQQEVHIGNFVELKNSQVAEGSKINHLSYVGDTDVGKQVNIGAGTITCNYDGTNKYRTVIGDQAFIGSNSQLVAPVKVGEGATIGAGSTITRDAPANQLTVARGRQVSIAGWKRPQKKSP